MKGRLHPSTSLPYLWNLYTGNLPAEADLCPRLSLFMAGSPSSLKSRPGDAVFLVSSLFCIAFVVCTRTATPFSSFESDSTSLSARSPSSPTLWLEISSRSRLAKISAINFSNFIIALIPLGLSDYSVRTKPSEVGFCFPVETQRSR